MTISRRFFMCSLLSAPVILSRPALSWGSRERILHMWNPRTNEVYHRVYHDGYNYIPDATREFDNFARDWRQNAIIEMSRETMDFLSLFQEEFADDSPFHLLSGYRTRQTNQEIAKTTSGVARESFHMQGKALDIRHQEIGVSDLAYFAKDASLGGVGVYSQSNFIHIDSAEVRSWGS